MGTNQSDTHIDPYSATNSHSQALNQTYGWGCESGDQYGDGMSFDSGVGTNQSDADLYPYNAVASKTVGGTMKAAAALAPIAETEQG